MNNIEENQWKALVEEYLVAVQAIRRKNLWWKGNEKEELDHDTEREKNRWRSNHVVSIIIHGKYLHNIWMAG